MRKIKSYVKDTAGNSSKSAVPGEGGVTLEHFFEGVTRVGAFVILLE